MEREDKINRTIKTAREDKINRTSERINSFVTPETKESGRSLSTGSTRIVAVLLFLNFRRRVLSSMYRRVRLWQF